MDHKRNFTAQQLCNNCIVLESAQTHNRAGINTGREVHNANLSSEYALVLKIIPEPTTSAIWEWRSGFVALRMSGFSTQEPRLSSSSRLPPVPFSNARFKGAKKLNKQGYCSLQNDNQTPKKWLRGESVRLQPGGRGSKRDLHILMR